MVKGSQKFDTFVVALLGLTMLVGSWTSSAWGQTLHEGANCPSINLKLAPIPSSVQNLTPTVVTTLTVPQKALVAQIEVDAAPIRYTTDGTTPVATTTGMLVFNTASAPAFFILCGQSMTTFKMLQESAGAKVSVLYYGMP